ncbi:MAG: DinB family protein [Lacibacter sp.]
MKQINSDILLDQLQSDVREIILQASRLKQTESFLLNQSPSVDKWSVAQVLEHLNFYCSFYIPAIEKKLHRHQTKPQRQFSPGWLGNYFTKLMKPSDANRIVKKMKSPGNALPSAQPDAGKMLDAFLLHQHHLLNLLQISGSANLNSVRIPTSLSRFVTLKLGDTYRFFIAHEERHFVQINQIIVNLQQTAGEQNPAS